MCINTFFGKKSNEIKVEKEKNPINFLRALKGSEAEVEEGEKKNKENTTKRHLKEKTDLKIYEPFVLLR